MHSSHLYEINYSYASAAYSENIAVYIPGVPELPHDILIAYSGVKIKTKFERINVEDRRVFKW
jgi:hypothetical protein